MPRPRLRLAGKSAWAAWAAGVNARVLPHTDDGDLLQEIKAVGSPLNGIQNWGGGEAWLRPQKHHPFLSKRSQISIPSSVAWVLVSA